MFPYVTYLTAKQRIRFLQALRMIKDLFTLTANIRTHE